MGVQINPLQRIEEISRYDQAVSEYRSDGYMNMLTKVGTMKDNSTAWEYSADVISSDAKLSSLYIGNGLFAKIIDRPAEDAIAKGLDLSDLGDELEKEVLKKLGKLDFTDTLATAEKWSRLYGGALVVMLVDDGRGLDEPLNWKNVKSIEELITFERPIVQADTLDFSYFHDIDREDRERKFGDPEFYDVYSQYGSFRVHYSRCLVFRNGRVPESANSVIYKHWGIPVYMKIREALRETITSHHDGTKLLERSVLGVYKMKNLSQLLATEEGEDKVIQRLQVIDMARNIINSMAIDNDGEDYQYINASMSGASDLIDRTCNMLSAVTDIPQTILFGKDPAGEDSTGDNDRDNYFQLLNRIQANSYHGAAEKVIRAVLKEIEAKKKVDIPDYEVRFKPLKQLSEEEQANVDSIKAGTEQTKASTAQIYVDMQALDPSEVRKGLADSNEYQIQGIVENDNLEIPDEAFDLRKQQAELNKISDPQGEENPQESADNLQQDGMMNVDGGKGSGNFNHAGRPGKRGGSASTGSGTGAPGSYHGKDNPAAQSKWDGQKAASVRDSGSAKFCDALSQNKGMIDPKKQWRVDTQSPQELTENHPNAQLLMSPGGNTIAVDNDTKDIVAVSARKDGSQDESGRAMMKAAVEHGGMVLDSYSGNHAFYTKCGFEPVSWVKFDEQYAPPGWRKGIDHPEPVIFYRYTGRCTAEKAANGFLATVAPSASYDEAMAARDALVKGET